MMWQNENYQPRELTAQERLQICSQCPFMQRTRLSGMTCGTLLKPEYDQYGNELTCGCVLNVKARMKNQHCPQNKW